MQNNEVFEMPEKTEATHNLLIEIIYTSKSIEEARQRTSELLKARAEALHIKTTKKNE